MTTASLAPYRDGLKRHPPRGWLTLVGLALDPRLECRRDFRRGAESRRARRERREPRARRDPGSMLLVAAEAVAGAQGSLAVSMMSAAVDKSVRDRPPALAPGNTLSARKTFGWW